jgi:hypothetical protein
MKYYLEGKELEEMFVPDEVIQRMQDLGIKPFTDVNTGTKFYLVNTQGHIIGTKHEHDKKAR